jgi:hypothetical protein
MLAKLLPFYPFIFLIVSFSLVIFDRIDFVLLAPVVAFVLDLMNDPALVGGPEGPTPVG